MIRSRAVPVVGTVCMDLTMVDVTDHPDVVAGDPAVLLGDSPDAWDVGGWAGTNGWDSLTRIGRRVARVYVEEARIIDVVE
jgi:alanine racemase